LQKAKEAGLTHLIKKVKQRTITTSGKNEDTEMINKQPAIYGINRQIAVEMWERTISA
jgi:hypothetical protein